MKCRNEDGLNANGYCLVTNRYCTAQFAAICKSFAPKDKVVHCGECAFYRPEPMGDVMMCYGFANGHWTEPDDFCSRGRRRDDNEKD